MKTKFLPQLFFLFLVSFSLYSCTEDAEIENKSQATDITPSNPKAPTNVTAEDIIYKPR